MTTDHYREVIWKPALKQAGVTYRPPIQIRHAFATLAIDSGEVFGWCGGVVALEPRFYGDVWVKRLENGLKCLEKKQKCLKIGGNFNLREI